MERVAREADVERQTDGGAHDVIADRRRHVEEEVVVAGEGGLLGGGGDSFGGRDQVTELVVGQAEEEVVRDVGDAGCAGVDPRARRCAIAADRIALERAARGGFRAGRSLRAYGPRTRREFLAFLRNGASLPG